MGFWGFVIFALKCFDVLAWPLFALGYPLCASIQAIETKSNWHTRKLVTYWVLFSLISLFEHAFVKLLEWVPFWSYTKLIIICWLVIPRFDGACYIYKHLVRPCLSMDLQTLIKWFDKWKDFVLKRDDILAQTERHVKENGPEALEKIIASKIPSFKEVQKEWACAICQVTTESKTTLNLHLQGWRHQSACEKLKAKTHASKIVKVTEKKEVTKAEQVNQPEPNIAHIEKRTFAPVEIKETTAAVEAGEKHPQIPAFKEVQKEWTCAICQITTPSETTLNLHLQEKQHRRKEREHQATCEKLKANNQASNTVEVPEKKEVVEATQVNQSEPNLAHIEDKTFAPVEIKETTAALEAGGEHPQVSSYKEDQKEWACAICQITTQSETTLNLHLQGWRHQAACEKVIAKNRALKTVEVTEKKEVTEVEQVNQPEPNLAHIENRTFAPMETKETTATVEVGGEHPQIPAFKEVQKEWTCAICHITTQSETTLNLHLQGWRHQAACEKLTAKSQASKTVEVTEKKEVAEAEQVNQPEPNLSHIENRTFAPVETKETTTAMVAGGEHPQIPAFTEVQKEWTCAICQITTPNETTLNLHLQEKQHRRKERRHQRKERRLQAACEKLKVNNQASKTVEVTEKKEVPEATQVNQSEPNLAHMENKTFAPVEFKETTVAVEAGGEHPQEVQKEWACAICQVTTQSETTLNLHPQGWRHQADCEKLKAKNQALKTVEVTKKKEVIEAQQVNQPEPNLAHIEDKTFAPVEIKETTAAVEAGREHPQISSFKEVQKEWICAICQITTPSETVLNLHLQGKQHRKKERQHQAACENLKANNQASKTVEVTDKKEVAEAMQVNQSEPNLGHIENKIFKETTVAVEAGREHPQIPSFKQVQKEWACAICQVTTQSETTQNLHIQGWQHQAACEKLKGKNQASKTVEVTVKKDQQVNQPEPNLAHIENRTFAPEEIKEPTAAVEAGREHPQIPSFKEVQKEWICAICQITTTSEKTLNLHLQGKQHQAACEKLKANNQASKTVEVIEQLKVTETMQVNQSVPNLAHIENKTFTPVEIEETTTAVEAGGEHPQIPSFEEVQKEWACAISQVTTQSETTLNLHLQGWRHQAACEKHKEKNQALKTVEVAEKKEVTEAVQANQPEPNLAHMENKTFAPVEIKETTATVEAGQEHPQIPSFKEVQKEWICAICQITTTSEKTLNLHFQGKRHQKKERQHQAACKKLKVNNQASESIIGPASASKKSDLPKVEKCVSSHKITNQKAKRSDLPKEVAKKCASSSGLKRRVIATHEVDKSDVLKEEEEKCVSNNGSNCKLKSKSVLLVAWSPPAEGWFKLNTNGSCLGNLGQAAAGGIIRDQWGNWLTGFSRSLQVTHSLAAELRSLRDGLFLALNFNLKNLEVEIDAAVAVELIRNCFDPHHPLSALLDDCRWFLNKLDRYTITHIPSEVNYCAGALAREAYNLNVSFKVYDLPPGCISNLIYADVVGVNHPIMYSV